MKPDLYLKLEHGSKFLLRILKWLVTDKPIAGHLLKTSALEALGFNTCELVASSIRKYSNVARNDISN